MPDISVSYSNKETQETAKMREKARIAAIKEAERIAAMPNYFDVKVTEDFFKEIKNSISSISNFTHYLLINDFYGWFGRHTELPNGIEPYQIGRYMILSDIKTAFIAMGSSIDYKSKEGLALLMASNILNSNENIEYGMLKMINEETIQPAKDLLDGAYNLFNKEADNNKLVFADVLQKFDRDIQLQYLVVLYRFFSVAAKADEIVTEQEADYLKQLLVRAQSIDNNVEVEKDIIATLNVTFEMIHAGKSDEYDIGKYIVRAQKCVISDIQAELKISRARV